MRWGILGILLLVTAVSRAEEPAALEEAVAIIRSRFPQQVSEEALYRAALEGMAAHLNQLSGAEVHAVLTPQEHAEREAWLRGDREGLGFFYQVIPGQGLLLEDVYPGGAAERAGLQRGDVIIAINGHPFTGLSDALIYEIAQQARQETIKLDLQRGAGELLHREVRRGPYRVPAVQRDPDMPACLKMAFFGEGSAAALARALGGMEDEPALILDLRDNQGGQMDEALAAASLFLDPGSVVVRRRLPDGREESLRASGERRWRGRAVVLVNERTSGVAEAFASALQAHRAASVVGTASAGLAAEPGYYPLSGGMVLQLADTTLYSPTGRSWAGVGVAPDLVVEALELRLSGAPPHRPPDLQRDAAVQLIVSP